MKRFLWLTVLLMLGTACTAKYDVVVIGGGTGGTAAAIEAARNGVSVLIIEQSPWLGGMLTSAGVSAVDGNYRLRGGIFAEFSDSQRDMVAMKRSNQDGSAISSSIPPPGRTSCSKWPGKPAFNSGCRPTFIP